jgi:hypothetical protein
MSGHNPSTIVARRNGNAKYQIGARNINLSVRFELAAVGTVFPPRAYDPFPSLRPNGNGILLAARIRLAVCRTTTARAAAPLRIPFDWGGGARVGCAHERGSHRIARFSQNLYDASMRHSPRRSIAARFLSLGLAVLVLVTIAGCYTIRTPDGHTLTSLSTAADVRAKLGEPDLVEEEETGGFKVYGDWRRHHAYGMTYLDRSYCVWLIDGRARNIHEISESERPGVAERARVYKASTEPK